MNKYGQYFLRLTLAALCFASLAPGGPWGDAALAAPGTGQAASGTGQAKPGTKQTASGSQESSRTGQEYREYQAAFQAIHTKDAIEPGGFQIVEKQIFPVELIGVGEVSFIPAYDRESNRLALFFANEDGSIVFKTDQLETNDQIRGSLKQPNQRLAAVSFQDMDHDGSTDIVLITACAYGPGEYQGRTYKVGDVLFQKDGGFYRDYRLSDKINRFGMNKSIRFVTSFVRDGFSTEFLYTATTQKELLDNGFQISTAQYGLKQFEKLGSLRLVPGTYRMAEYTVFMMYLVNEQGYIVWSFQPMGDYESLYGLKGINCLDIDGDGLKDIVVLASYSYAGNDGESVVEADYSVYYQRTGGFYEDTEIKHEVTCNDSTTMNELVGSLRAYWGWKSGQ